MERQRESSVEEAEVIAALEAHEEELQDELADLRNEITNAKHHAWGQHEGQHLLMCPLCL